MSIPPAGRVRANRHAVLGPSNTEPQASTAPIPEWGAARSGSSPGNSPRGTALTFAKAASADAARQVRSLPSRSGVSRASAETEPFETVSFSRVTAISRPPTRDTTVSPTALQSGRRGARKRNPSGSRPWKGSAIGPSATGAADGGSSGAPVSCGVTRQPGGVPMVNVPARSAAPTGANRGSGTFAGASGRTSETAGSNGPRRSNRRSNSRSAATGRWNSTTVVGGGPPSGPANAITSSGAAVTRETVKPGGT